MNKYELIKIDEYSSKNEDFLNRLESILSFEVVNSSFFKNDDVFDVKTKHMYIKSHKAFFCLKGSIKIKVGLSESIINLDDNVLLHVFPKTWIHVFDRSEDSLFVVFSSHEFKLNDFIKEKPWDD